MNLYLEKESKYFTIPRLELISFIPKDEKNKILEIGAGAGDTLLKIKELNLAQFVVGVDIIKLDKSNQSNPLIDQFFIGNIENEDFDLPTNHFDVIICGDVLEHLVDPWKVVEKLTKLLKPLGVLIVSIPNIRDISTMYKIFYKGDFNYTSHGILDKTHLRFFCKKNLINLLQNKRLSIKTISSNIDLPKSKSKRRIINKLTLGIFKHFLVTQYFIVSQKS